ncbi:amino acid adenylation domain-containing protein [Streptomyces sp. HK10]|uniref:non-ribosomal peptide synthetase n=1 Tax=Streptomyces sp. HK10 TaxID=3373255 RepID=UPI00374A4BE1
MTPSVTEAFIRQARSAPGADAVVDGADRLTYGQLLDAARALAARLGSGPEQGVPVAICLNRSPSLVTAVLGTLLAGRPYVPLDPAYPDARLRHMLADSGARVVLCDRRTAEEVPALASAGEQVRLLHLDDAERPAADEDPALPQVRPDDLAYILYTSGSTGLPKGVAMAHGSLSRLIDWHARTDEPQDGLATAQFAPISFDVSFQEIFATLCTGGTLVLVDVESRRDPDRLLALLTRHRVTRLFLPAAALHQIAQRGIRQNEQPALRDIVCAGEQLQVTQAVVDWLRAMPGCRLHNHYGPTESHVVTAHVLTGDPDRWPRLPPIGTPLPHVETRLLDSAGRPVPDGEPGELHLGGPCLATGYLGRPDLTAERFGVAADGTGRWYRTGDLARRLPGGVLEYLGRNDRQVKIRGHRVEVGEVELALTAHRDVAECCVVTTTDQAGQQQLAAYLVPAPGSAEYGTAEPVTLRFVPKWHHHLSERLPEFMVPTTYVVMDRLPLTPSGKVDRAALPAPSTARPALAVPFVAPSTERQELIAAIWRETLQLDEVGLDDNFFDLGGNSLLVTHLHTRLTDAIGRRFPLVAAFDHPTIRSLAEYLDHNAAGSARKRPAQRRSRRERPVRRGSAVVKKDTSA